MTPPKTLIDIQQEYVDTVNSCYSRHVNRVQRGAVRKLVAELHRQGFEYEQIAQAMQDADEMMLLERNEKDLATFGGIDWYCRDAGVAGTPSVPTLETMGNSI